ncbi:MFS transporter, partial [Paraburkholderia sp. Se-20369]|nr:MFS transporter [Paraburkholderia sp. Se-20369]
MSSDSAIPPRSGFAVTLQIISVVCFTFICYLTIGLPLAVLPGFVHDDLGFSAIVAGGAISVQYLATLASRPLAGRFADTLGPKRTVMRGLIGCGVSGVLLLLALLLAHWPAASLVLLVASRLLLGLGESLCGTGAILWGIGRVGITHNAKVISWNGIATYGALALGAPVGVAIAHALNPALIGVIVIALAALGFYLARLIDAVPLVHGERMSYASVFARVLPHGIGLALGSAGFGSIATFVTLYYAARHWPNAALSLTVFGALFIGARLLFANAIKSHGGFREQKARA